jgi:large subunit ribosomal protein L9
MSKRNVQVVLRQAVPSLGQSGDVIGVSPGYARNYLFPRGLASRVTPGILKTVALRQELVEHRKQEEKQLAESRKTALETINRFVIRAKVGEADALFGTITHQDVVDVVRGSSGIEIDKRTVKMEDIKKTGVYPVEIRLHPDVTATLRLQVTPA